jgi:predicted enzyme related to lactoylglutathione lyase
VQNVFVVAKEPASLHAFYEGALGLPMKFRDGDRWIQYGVGNTNVALACLEEAAPATSGLVLVLEVEDFEGAPERIIAAGGQVLDLRDMGSHGAVLSLRDPEGNLLQLFRRAAPTAA